MGLALADPRPGAEPVLGLTRAALAERLAEMGLPTFRSGQLVNALFARRVPAFDQVTTLPRALREQLAARFSLERPRLSKRQLSTDGTRKYRFLTADHRPIESVYIPDLGRRRRTNTLCVSSQTGCAVGCKFCFTAQFTRHRNLTAAEIIGQVLAVADDVAELGDAGLVTNIVFMGMGEPLLNFEAVVTACDILLDPEGLGFSQRRVTVSTSGIVPKIAALGARVGVQLAVSLNATSDATRTAIMPINKTWGLDGLMAALRAYPLAPRRRITLEYVLLGGVNDTDDDLARLPALVAGMPVKINLLPLNPHTATDFRPPSAARVAAFREGLSRAGLNVSVRTPRGQDIDAACGQLGEPAVAPPRSAGPKSA